MSYQIKRIDPYWLKHPLVPVAVAGGTLLTAVGFLSGRPPVWIAGAVLASLGVLAAAKPVVSCVLGSLGLIGGIVTFVVSPNMQTADMAMHWRVFSAVLFAVLYMVLMDALVLGVALLYNLFGAVTGGIRVDFEESAEGAEAE